MGTGHSEVLQARIAGLLYLVVLGAGVFTEFGVLNALLVRGDASATLQNIRVNESLYRWGFIADLIDYSGYLLVSALLYSLLKRVDVGTSRVAFAFCIVATSIVASCSIAYLVPLMVKVPGPFGAELAVLALRVRTVGYAVSLAFFSVHVALIGILAMRSRFIAWLPGALMVAAGSGFFVFSLASVLSPSLSAVLTTYALGPCVLAEVCFAGWLLIFGLNVQKWRSLNDHQEQYR